MHFRRKPVIVDAMLYSGENGMEIEDWSEMNVLRSSALTIKVNDGIYLEMQTKYGIATAKPGDWIVKGACGKYYPVRPDEFKENYEEYDGPEKPRICKTVTKDGQ